MQIIITNTLTSRQYHEALSLINECKEFDNTRGISFLEPEMNYYSEFPCFYMLYDNDILASFLSVFIPNSDECEIYANTMPDYRRKGYFEYLLDDALKHLKQANIEKILIVNEPGCMSGTDYLKNSENTTFAYSEYLMKYDMVTKPVPKNILTLESFSDDNTETFFSYQDGQTIGSCKVEHNRGVATIYEFEITPALRGNGFGTETLLLILEQLLSSGCHKILLQVNGANTAAHAMYTHHGFIHEEQIDYWIYA